MIADHLPDAVVFAGPPRWTRDELIPLATGASGRACRARVPVWQLAPTGRR